MRPGYPQTSEYEKGKKSKKLRKSQRRNWKKEAADLGMNKTEIGNRRNQVSQTITQLENEVKTAKDDLIQKGKERWRTARELRLLKKPNQNTTKSKIRRAYQKLAVARTRERDIQKVLIPKERELREKRQENYCLNKMYDVAPDAVQSGGMEVENAGEAEEGDGGAAQTLQEITWDRHNFESYVEEIDISALLRSRGNLKEMVFHGIDPGVKVMNTGISQTCGQMLAHLNRY